MRKYYLCHLLQVLKASYVLAIAVAVATLVPVSLGLAGLGPETGAFGFYNNADSRIEDAKGDVEPVYQQSGAGAAPGARDYHDIVSASVKKQGDTFLFTIELAGNPNENENHETLYLWNIVTEVAGKEQQQYRILLPNFATGNNSTERGWYFAVFNVTADTYIVPMTKISDMPEDRVEFPVKDFFIGTPSSFRYWVDVYVRTNNTLVGPPDYLMDYTP
jgi:hypothetical protein